MARSASLLIALGVLASCSFTTAGSFKECNSDSDCGSATACSKGYCLTLPEGCKREEAGGKIHNRQMDKKNGASVNSTRAVLNHHR